MASSDHALWPPGSADGVRDGVGGLCPGLDRTPIAPGTRPDKRPLLRRYDSALRVTGRSEGLARPSRQNREGEIMVSLYKRLRGYAVFWEAWEEAHQIHIRHGKLGELGQMETCQASERAREDIAQRIALLRADGFVEIGAEDRASVILQYRVHGWGTATESDRREAITELLDDCLGATGLGECTGRDMGGGTMNFFCLVVDPELAASVIRRGLEVGGCLEGAIIAGETDDGAHVYWPPDFQDEFTY